MDSVSSINYYSNKGAFINPTIAYSFNNNYNAPIQVTINILAASQAQVQPSIAEKIQQAVAESKRKASSVNYAPSTLEMNGAAKQMVNEVKNLFTVVHTAKAAKATLKEEGILTALPAVTLKEEEKMSPKLKKAAVEVSQALAPMLKLEDNFLGKIELDAADMGADVQGNHFLSKIQLTAEDFAPEVKVKEQSQKVEVASSGFFGRMKSFASQAAAYADQTSRAYLGNTIVDIAQNKKVQLAALTVATAVAGVYSGSYLGWMNAPASFGEVAVAGVAGVQNLYHASSEMASAEMKQVLSNGAIRVTQVITEQQWALV